MADAFQQSKRPYPVLMSQTEKDAIAKQSIAELLGKGALFANSFMPVTGDIQSGILAANDVKNGDYGSAALNGLGILPFIPALAGVLGKNSDSIANVLKKTKYELAHETAQKNAVEMLGLPPNNTAMDRARAMGFDTPAYHGTDADIKEFNKSFDKLDRGFWFGSEDVANRFASADERIVDGGNIISSLIKQKNPYIYNATDPNRPAKLKDIFEQLDKTKNDGVKFVGGKSTAFTVNEPNQIRSRFAAFDPARAHEADLLGAATPEMMGILAAGSAGGIAYAHNKKKNKK